MVTRATGPSFLTCTGHGSSSICQSVCCVCSIAWSPTPGEPSARCAAHPCPMQRVSNRRQPALSVHVHPQPCLSNGSTSMDKRPNGRPSLVRNYGAVRPSRAQHNCRRLHGVVLPPRHGPRAPNTTRGRCHHQSTRLTHHIFGHGTPAFVDRVVCDASCSVTERRGLGNRGNAGSVHGPRASAV